MEKDLMKAHTHVGHAKHLLRRHFSKRLWPCFYEDIDHLIQAINDCLDAIRNRERLPP